MTAAGIFSLSLRPGTGSSRAIVLAATARRDHGGAASKARRIPQDYLAPAGRILTSSARARSGGFGVSRQGQVNTRTTENGTSSGEAGTRIQSIRTNGTVMRAHHVIAVRRKLSWSGSA